MRTPLQPVRLPPSPRTTGPSDDERVAAASQQLGLSEAALREYWGAHGGPPDGIDHHRATADAIAALIDERTVTHALPPSRQAAPRPPSWVKTDRPRWFIPG